MKSLSPAEALASWRRYGDVAWGWIAACADSAERRQSPRASWWREVKALALAAKAEAVHDRDKGWLLPKKAAK